MKNKTKQKAKAFDPVTVQKLIRSFGLSLLGGLSAGLGAYSASNSYKVGIIAGLAAMLAPFGANTAIQYNRGDKAPQ